MPNLKSTPEFGPDSDGFPACQQAIWSCETLAISGVSPYVGAMRIALYQPDIAGNVGTILRTAACFGVAVDIIEPCGFPFSARALKRAGMDYAAHAAVARHASWDAYVAAQTSGGGRLVLFTTQGAVSLNAFVFRPDDRLLFGSETGGVPGKVHVAADARVAIPLQVGFRSLNVAVAAGIGVAEALRQCKGFGP